MTRTLPAVRILRLSNHQATTSSLPSRIHPRSQLRPTLRPPPSRYKKPRYLPLRRIFPGPPLQGETLDSDYFIAFHDQKHHSIGAEDSTELPPEHHLFAGYNKMKCWVQILSTPTADTPGTTLLLHFDSRRYLVGNVAEGTQRASVQRKLGLTRVGDIFLTGTVGWATAGGLLGMILTLADATTTSNEGKREHRQKWSEDNVPAERSWLNLHGGKNLTHLLATARRFIFRKGMPLLTNELTEKVDLQRKNWEPTWKDDRIKVWSMVIEPEGRSARKRSHDEFTESTLLESTDGKQETLEEQEDRHDQMRKAVVSNMFDSDWRLDALIKRKLSEVKRPAAIFFRDEKGTIQRYLGPTLDEDPSLPDMDVLVRNPWPGAMIETLPHTTPSASSVCYIMKNYPQRGKFNPKVAKELGVVPGSDFRALTEGKSVTTPDGKVVTSEQVLAPGKEGGGFAVIELPDDSYIGPLLAREEWSSKEVMTGIGAVIWILGPGLVEDPRLQQFMKEHSEMQHIVSSKDCCSNYLALESPASAAIRLHLLDSERFPIPVHSNEVPLPQAEGPRPYTKARAGLTLQLEPKIEVQVETIIRHLDTAEVIREMPKEVLNLAKKAREEVVSAEFQAKLDQNQKDIPSRDAEVITLGTGSALPSKYRNVSATLLRVPGYGSYLFDCGENTLGQLKRVFGDELPEVLRDLKVIWISHLHADHHLGTVSVIRAWAKETSKETSTKNNKLIAASDDGMINWLQEYCEIEEYGQDRVEHIIINSKNVYDHQFNPEETRKFGLSSIEACPVEHCHGALAVAFTFPNGFKVAYSGDCRPSQRFAKIGEGATLLIHEATFDDELQSDAYAKKHSTTAEALAIGKKMNARRILLTHFSQRYQKIPVMDSHGGKDQVAIVAFDYMRVKVGDFAKLEAFKPALMKLYENEEA
jgi:ribonuclease Z